MSNKYVPNAKVDLKNLFHLLAQSVNFVYVRFSDGESEILRNRYNKITESEVVYRGRTWKSIFPEYDQKEFNPVLHQDIRTHLMASVFHKSKYYFKGIPTSHNIVKRDKAFYLRLNGGLDKQITFSDLLMNNNHNLFIRLLQNYIENNPPKKIVIVSNYRSIPIGFLSNAEIIPIGDNFFLNYLKTKEHVIEVLKNLDKNTLILSSASSLSNILGHFISFNELPLTFIDVGTSLHEFLSLDNSSRRYSKSLVQKKIRW